jgi:glutamate-1-semialdehyde 2,1-aminomutase
MSTYSESAKLFEKAKTLMPGGVNSPVRAFNSVEGEPIFIKKGKGAKIWDEDGNEYIDFCGSWGPLILGHANEKVEVSIIDSVKRGPSFGAPTVAENSLAQLIIDNHRFLEKIRFTSSGTEAVMSALRLARGITGKSKILKFDGCYHGHVDSLLVNAGSGLATLGTGSSAGIPDSFAKETVVAPLNDMDALKEAFTTFTSELAAVIIEPIPANNGLLVQNESYLRELRKLCTEHKVLLIFDEVISGFRVGFEGAAGLYNIEPDLMTYGKIIGGGMPVGAYGGKTEYMDMVAPVGPVYQAGTLSGNPVAMSAGWAQISQCLEKGFYNDQADRTDFFAGLINEHSDINSLPIKLVTVGSIFWMHHNDGETIQKASEIKPEKNNWFQHCHRKLMDAGVYFGPSAYEVGFISAAHDKETLQKAANIVNAILLNYFKA